MDDLLTLLRLAVVFWLASLAWNVLALLLVLLNRLLVRLQRRVLRSLARRWDIDDVTRLR